ncbi:DUF983 domain-containing protein [Roseomonas eburnea]|uniref:DUF983 domain-containing protein n=1 Tax=Neoroseomonas eburnea TaxID=1346889 RepID=A0A9X9XAK0_9PROT|nr:DUF983 domain-containing protein [Neoroseomonas eburnea]MBR0680736.1 DUF983 domain-containing protein [Neoroseomonas eburnea]
MPWTSERETPALSVNPPPIGAAMARGAMGRCPVCGQGRLFNGYLRVVDACESCHAPLGRMRADDAPPYFTILIAGHVLLPAVFWVEKLWQPPMWLHMAVWLPLFAIVCTLLLRPVKGATLAWMLRLGLTGDEQGAPVPAPVAPRRTPGDA